MATVSNDRPWVRTSRSGVAPRKVVPFRVKANVVLSGAVRARCRSAATTSRSAVARRTSRRASTTLSIRPRPTAPANRPTVRSQSGRSGRSSIGRSAPAAVPAPSRASLEADEPLDWSSAARATACQAACTSPGSGSSDRSAASATVSVADDPCLVTPNVGSTSDEAPNDAHGSPASGCVAAEPETTEQDRAAIAVTVVRCAVDPIGVGQDPAPGLGRLAEATGSSGLDRPRASDADDRAVGGRLEPERRLEVERARPPRTGRSDRSGRWPAWPCQGCRGPAPRDAASSAVTAVAISGVGRRRPTVDDGHGVMAEWSAIRASGTPTLRSRSARSVG